MTEKISSITPCKECGNDENFEIIKIRAMTGRFIADCKCPECGTINTLELLAPDEVLKEKIRNWVSNNIHYECYGIDNSWDFKKELEAERRRSFNCSDRMIR